MSIAQARQVLQAGGWLRPKAVFDGRHIHGATAVRLTDHHLEMRQAAFLGEPATPFDGYLSPGFFDIQVNGGGGVLFNADQSEAGLRTIAEAHRRGGTAFFLPTVITDAPEVLERAADAVIALYGRHGIAGIHIEGPHISLLRRGTHKAEFIRPYDGVTDKIITRLRDADVPVLLTVAPEDMPKGAIASLAERGVVVSLGHSNADYVTTMAALSEGARHFTHLMNAMPAMEHRAPGIVGAALNSDAYCSLIFDGLHVAPETLQIVLNARHRVGRMIAVTDAMPTLFGPDHFRLYDMDVRLEGGKLINSEGVLAGAHVTMLQSLSMLVDRLGVSLEAALQSVLTHPADLMGKETAFSAFVPEDFIVFSADLQESAFVVGEEKS